ncbi:MAG TPA: hypothetical protein VGK67_18120 [Myxococcales bacterium]|jgi:hypothetical protein
MPDALPLSSEHHSLLEAVVALPSGVELLREGHLESVSVLFGAHPAVVDEVRGWMGSKAQRKLLAEALLRARNRKPAALAPASVAPAPPVPATPEELLRAALEVPGGDEFLAEAPLETVAIVFGVHPDLAAKARDLVAPSAKRASA